MNFHLKKLWLKFILFFLFALFFILPCNDSYALKPFYHVNYSSGYKFKTVIAPGAVKFNKLKFTLFITKSGRPVQNFRGKVSLSMPGMYMGKNIATIHPVSGAPGKYITYIYFTMGGLWKIDYILYDGRGKLIRFSNKLNVN
ncbi:MAG: FixH family protein [Deltaproteobacteria bacterium]|nr:FixH family protein [Deltaproteobacteria bacterium]MCL5892588.1 FixH family protein [Deltaproteobacteria bacterium]